MTTPLPTDQGLACASKVMPTDRQAMLKQLRADFPRCFASKQKAVQPIAVGILDELMKHYRAAFGLAFKSSLLRDTLKYYTNGFAYLKSFSQASHRIDLQGQPCGAIGKEERVYARKQWHQLHRKNTQATPSPTAPDSVASSSPPPPPEKRARPRLTLKKPA